MENTKEKIENTYIDKTENTMLEKKIIVYLLIFTILLMYFALYAIHNIIDVQVIKDIKTADIVYPGNTVDNPDNQGNTGNTDNKNQNDNNSTVPVVDNNDRFRILEGSKDWNELKELSIFSELQNGHVAKGKIAPGVSGTYNFTVENYGTYNMKYDITFSDYNPYNINMKFKLKLNGKYVVGDESTWKNAGDLTQMDRLIDAHSNDIYTIEWKWVDAPNDTEIGETDGSFYTLKAKGYAEQQ